MIFMEWQDRLADVLRRPGAYGLRTLEQAVAFIGGFDAGLEWAPLAGFREWLVGKTGEGANLAWPALIKRVGSIQYSEGEGQVAAFFELLREFKAERE
jgi:hypothetical protein